MRAFAGHAAAIAHHDRPPPSATSTATTLTTATTTTTTTQEEIKSAEANAGLLGEAGRVDESMSVMAMAEGLRREATNLETKASQLSRCAQSTSRDDRHANAHATAAAADARPRARQLNPLPD